MIAGLLRNTSTNTIDKTPFLGNLPVIGALFRSNRFRRAETELVIIVTPYLVQPMNPNRVALPTDGFRAADDGQRLLGGEMHDGRSRDIRPEPTVAAPRVVPGIGAGGSAQAQPRTPMPSTAGRPAQGRSAPPPPRPARPTHGPVSISDERSLHARPYSRRRPCRRHHPRRLPKQSARCDHRGQQSQPLFGAPAGGGAHRLRA
jgi:pilus assembly protein CpaC